MKKILLTGASGFIGRHCLPLLLERGYEVHALALVGLPEFEKDVVWHNENILDTDAILRLMKNVHPSHCLHLAWYTEQGKYWISPENLRWTAASLSLLLSFYENDGERFVGAGTCAEYDWRYGHCSEAVTPLQPTMLYGTAKHAFGSMLSSFSKTVSLSSAWGRVFFLYGPHEHPARLTPSIITSLLRHEPALSSHGNQVRDLMHVADVAGALVYLLDSEVKGAVNIASGKPVQLKDVIYEIARQLDGFDLLRLGALPAKDEPALLTADVGRLQQEVGYCSKFSLESGLAQTIAWWKEALEQNG